MNRKIIINSIFIALLILTVLVTASVNINNFGVGTTENLTFSGNQDILRNLSIYKYGYVYNAKMNLTGYLSNIPLNFQEDFGTSNQTNMDVNTVSLNYSGTIAQGSDGYTYDITYYKPTNVTLNSVIWQVKHGEFATYNVTVPTNCINNYSNKIVFHIVVGGRYYGSNNYTSYGTCNGNSSTITKTALTISASAPSYLTGDTSALHDGNYSTSMTKDGTIGATNLICNSANCLNSSWYEESLFWNVSNNIPYNSYVEIYNSTYRFWNVLNDNFQGQIANITSFNDSSTSGKLTFTANNNQTLFLAINKYVNVTNASLYINGSNVSNTTLNIGKYDNNYAWNITSAYSNVNNSLSSYSQLITGYVDSAQTYKSNDSNLSTFFNENTNFVGIHFDNLTYQLPQYTNNNSVYWNAYFYWNDSVDNGNLYEGDGTNPLQCFNFSSNSFIDTSLTRTITNANHNVTRTQLLPSDCISNTGKVIVNYCGTSYGYLYSGTITVPNQLKFYETYLNYTLGSVRQTNDFSNAINTALNNGSCDCSGGCSLSVNICTIPFIFHANNSGTLNYSLLNITFKNITKNNDFSNAINTALNNGSCDCSGCTLNGSNCLVPIKFHSDNAGIVNYANISIDYYDSLNVNLVSPTNNSVSGQNATLSCNINDKDNLQNITFYIWNSTNSLVQNVSYNITGRANSSSTNITFLTSDTYHWNCVGFNVNNVSATNTNNYTLIVDMVNPVINQILPTNNQWVNYYNNISFNCSAVSSNLSSMFLYDNFTGNFVLDKTLTGISSGNVNTIQSNVSSDGSYLWACVINKTTSGTKYYGQQGNYTLNIDTVVPTLSNIVVSTIANSQTFYVSFNATDTHLSFCKYTIYNNQGQVDGINNNVTTNCSSGVLSQINPNPVVSVSGANTYNITIYADDLAGNEGNITASIDTSVTQTSFGGGGGASASSGNATWTMLTSSGTNNLNLEMFPDTIRNDFVQFYNLNATAVNITLKLDQNISQIINMSGFTVNLAPSVGSTNRVEFTISTVNIPAGTYNGNIIATDANGVSVQPVGIQIVVSTSAVSYFTKLLSSRYIGGLLVPYWSISVLTMILLMTIFGLIFINNKEFRGIIIAGAAFIGFLLPLFIF